VNADLSRLDRPDAVETALAQVGDRWTFLVLREAFFGVRRFTELQRNLGIARNLLSQRLDQLVTNGLLTRRPYSEHPPRSEYRLTAKGLDLYTAAVALKQWAERWADLDTALDLRHAVDGGAVRARLLCDTCGEEVTAGQVHYQHTVRTRR
jgi:DNA-binding HxlR family transcriptional regulator